MKLNFRFFFTCNSSTYHDPTHAAPSHRARISPKTCRTHNRHASDQKDGVYASPVTSNDADFLKSYTTDYCVAFHKAGHLCKLLYYKDNKELTHAFPSLKTDLPESREVMEKMVAWIGQIESRNQLRFSSSTD